MDRAPDFFKQLNEQAYEALEELARQPGTTGFDCLEWLEARGVKTSKSAVYRWLQDFRLEFKNRRAVEMSRQYLTTIAEQDPAAISEAAAKKHEELCLEWLMTTDTEDPLDLDRIGRAIARGPKVRRENVELKARIEELEREKDQAKKELERLKGLTTTRQLTAADIEAASKAAFGS